MSKSLGNMYTLDDLAKLGHSPAALRYVLAGSYYRRPLNFTLVGMRDAMAALKRLRRFDDALAARCPGQPTPSYRDLIKNPPELGLFQPAWTSLQDDLNTPEALGHVFSALHSIKPAELEADAAAAVRRAFHFIIEALGLILPQDDEGQTVDVPQEIRDLAEERWTARLAKDWQKADELRSRLAERGWSMKDGRDSYQLTQN